MLLSLQVIFFVFGKSFAFYDAKEYYPFDDTRLYKLNWEKLDPSENVQPAPSDINQDLDTDVTVPKNPYEGLDSLRMKTANDEEYVCYLPNEAETKKDEMLDYKGSNPVQLMSPLMTQMMCSYKIESYWTYELCHGRHLRQYHEDRDSKKLKLQEYYLGHFDKDRLDALSKKFDESTLTQKDVPVRKIDSLSLPYLEIEMDGGTVCDLSGKPRSTRVIYVCHLPGKHEIYSIEEVSTCEYEVVILTPLICKHPLYKPIDSGERKIACVPVGDGPKRPVALMELDSESLLLRHQNILESFGLGTDSGIQIEVRAVGPKDSEELVTLFTPTKAKSQSFPEGKTAAEQAPSAGTSPTAAVFDQKLVEDFVNGDYCLYGGTGWWRYEFCYGKKVDQYHEEADGSRTVIHLGYFNREKHLEWLESHPQKRPKPIPTRKQVSQYYTEGSVCELTKQPRSVEVKFKCKEPGATQNAVSLYLLEPQPCEYVLGVEANFLCPLIAEADDNAEINLAEVLEKQIEL